MGVPSFAVNRVGAQFVCDRLHRTFFVATYLEQQEERRFVFFFRETAAPQVAWLVDSAEDLPIGLHAHEAKQEVGE